MKARRIKDVSEHFRGTAYVYQLDPPLEGNKFVVSSAANVPFSGPETYVFGSDQEGNVENFLELEGSFRGGLDCDKAIKKAGYEVVHAD